MSEANSGVSYICAECPYLGLHKLANGNKPIIIGDISHCMKL